METSLPIEDRETNAPREQECVTDGESLAFEIVRARVYRLIGALLAHAPQIELINKIKSIDLSDTQSTAPMTAAWSVLRDASLNTGVIASLSQEFHNLFIGVGRGELVPYASWYLSGLLQGKPLATLRKSLADLGMERKAETSEPEDHIAALCEVMSMLILEGGQGSFTDQNVFFTQYINPWASEFFDDLQHAPSARFYKAVGKFGTAFIDCERQYFSLTT